MSRECCRAWRAWRLLIHGSRMSVKYCGGNGGGAFGGSASELDDVGPAGGAK